MPDTMRDNGRQWYDLTRVSAEKLASDLSITFAFKATNNHVILDRGDKVFNRTAPMIKLPFCPRAREKAQWPERLLSV